MKVAGYTVPTIRLYPRLITTLRVIYTKFGLENIPNMEVLAAALKHKTANSGTFLLKLSCLRAYGLLKKRELKVSDLGRRLVTSRNDQERNEVLKQVIFNIPLWREFYDSWGFKVPERGFLEGFMKITGISREEAKQIAEKVKKAYLEDIRHIEPSESTTITYKPEIPSTPKSSEKIEEEITQIGSIPKTVLARVIVKDVGFVDVFDSETYKIAMSFMKLLEKRLTLKTSR